MSRDERGAIIAFGGLGLVQLTVELAAGRVRAARPSDCVMSIVAPHAEACGNDLRYPDVELGAGL